MPAPASQRATRKDAVRNRELLVDAAVAAFREQGLDASVNAIAEHAGVNVATLYRHFPTKEHLIAAVLETVLEPLAEARDRALATEDAGAALAVFFRAAVRLQSGQRGLVDALAHHPSAKDVRERLRQPAIDIVAPLVERAHAAGALRRDVDAIDLLVALRMLAVAAVPPGTGHDRADRFADVLLRGLRPDAR